MDFDNWLQALPYGDLIISVIIVAIALAIRILISRQIRGDSETLSAEQRKWLSITHNVTLLVILGLLLVVWAFELSRAAISVAAFAVAMVIGTKELILCFIGGLYRLIVRPFSGGDWIMVGDYRGEVLQEGLLATKLQELSPESDVRSDYTGETISMPNAMLLTHSVRDVNIYRNYVFHEFTLTLPSAREDTDAIFEKLKQTVDAEWAKSSEVAERYWSMVRNKSAVDFRKPDPSVILKTTELGFPCFNIRIFCKRNEAIDIQEHITLEFMKCYAADKPN